MKHANINSSQPRSSFGTALLKLLRFLIGFGLMGLVCGFLAFLLHIARTTPPDPLLQADGIVVLTGKGGGRLQAGARLLNGKYGERLLISGVNPSLNPQTVQSLLDLPDGLFQCCVDLDYMAEDTVGNGEQTANWAKALGYETVILVTSDYHMPRANVEISAAMDGIHIIPYPVKSSYPLNHKWWGGVTYWRRLIREFGKLLVSFAREPGSRPFASAGSDIKNNLDLIRATDTVTAQDQDSPSASSPSSSDQPKITDHHAKE